MFEIYFDTILNLYKKDLRVFFQDFYDFTQLEYSHIVNYYLGVEKLNKISFTKLEDLKIECKEIKGILTRGKTLFWGAAYWEILEALENCETKLISISKIWKYLRTSKNIAIYNQHSENLFLTQGGTVENILRLKRGDQDSQNSWVSTLIDNQISEEDYTPAGGLNFKVQLSNSDNYTQITDVVGELTGDLIYGVDIAKEIVFESDDLVVLSNKDTLVQAITILSGLKQGDNPEFPDHGLKTSFLGSNMNSVGYPMIFKQLISTFGNDDTLSTISVKDLFFDQAGNLILSLNIETKTKEIQETQLSL